MRMPVFGKPSAAVAAGLVILAVGPASASMAAPRAAEILRAAPGGKVATAPSATHGYVDLTFEVDGAFSTGVAGRPGHQAIFSPGVAPGQAMTGPAWPGGPVRLKRDTGSAAQVWEIAHPGSRARTEIINKRTGLCLDATRHAAGAQLITVICNGSKHQQWTERRQPNGTWRLSQGSSGPVLQAAAAGAHVRLAPRTSPRKLRNWVRRGPG
jgi:hypothetical protein